MSKGFIALLGGCFVNFTYLTITNAEVTTDGTLGQAAALDGPNYEITSDLGQIHGDNLFHSFSQFNLNSSESANFSGPANIHNIIGRITGGEQSFIDGSISSSIQGANLYLLNPHGILFGSNASLNISGSFYAGTADYLRLGSDGRFDAALTENTVLSVAEPSAFGFLPHNDYAGIDVDRAQLQVADNQSITLVGGDISIDGDGDNFMANLLAQGGTVNLVSTASAGEVNLGNGQYDASGFDRLGEITMSGLAYINTQGDSGGSVVIRGGRLVVDRATLYSSTRGSHDDDPGNGIIIYVQDELLLTNGARIGSNVYGEEATSDSGPVSIQTGLLQLSNGSSIESAVYTNAPGSAAGVSIEADTIQLSGNSYIRSTSSGSGNAGNININTTDINLENAYISTAAYASGNAGDITIHAENFSASGVKGLFRGLDASTSGFGDAGNINIDINNKLSISDYATFHTSTFGLGNAGRMNINAASVEILDGAYFATTGLFGWGGSAGDLNLNAKSLFISGVQESDVPFTWDFTGIQTASGRSGGQGGNLTLVVDELDITSRGVLSTASYGPGTGGELNILAESISLRNGAQVLSGAYGSGDGGDIVINTNRLLLTGVNEDPYINPYASVQSSEIVIPTTISAQAGFLGGSAGTVNIHADSVAIKNGARISSDTFGSGSGGVIDIQADSVLIEGKSQFLESFLIENNLQDSQQAARTARSGVFANVNTLTAEVGNAGTIKITSNDLSVSNGIVTTHAEGNGNGGNIQINSGNIVLNNDAILLSQSTGSGIAGKIELTAAEFHSHNSLISTQAIQSHGGNIEMDIAGLADLADSLVTTSVASEDGNGGNITIGSNLLVINDSTINAKAFEGYGGDISVRTDTMLITPSSGISASSEKSISGRVEISLGDNSISGLETLPTNMIDANRFFKYECAQGTKQFSSFALLGHTAIDAVSGNYIPSQFTTGPYQWAGDKLTMVSENTKETVIQPDNKQQISSITNNALFFDCQR